MTVTRRQMIRLAATSAAIVGVGLGEVPGAAAAVSGEASGGAAGAYRLGVWRGLVGSQVRFADRSAGSLEVVRVKDLSSVTSRNRQRGGGEVFSILLRGR